MFFLLLRSLLRIGRLRMRCGLLLARGELRWFRLEWLSVSQLRLSDRRSRVLFFKSLAHVSPRFRTPSTSLVLQGVLTSLLLLAIGRFQALFSLAIFGEWLFYAMTASTVFIFRRRDPAGTRAFSAWGYPVLPAVFIVAAAVLLVFSFADQPRNSIVGTAVILLGIPLHYLFQNRHAA
jgi:APA family basic amino acid/polyamine antiporter